ncbi:elongation factor P maturation arginine rhamnosyltransferase EarP [Pseudomonas sp. GD03860]|uniref:elongation factor P maturation arginine rhamnosyltransferase EarP n=1 Tax=Pseudomonas TaxID=286 RepID=UPI0023641CE3|nr:MULTISPECIES: elongation factor P maturation arginine rhamnosyltransferase EarP [Pseudomonas]MDD2056016.1 elongation factor P maturation arginine rhamnosyltransferase EarP [Pseudomonas putida]MDH0639644.1 elongation factor P maturation arginine rhamnosyltransferase EarP [Pseudomonas sp. GD03860]
MKAHWDIFCCVVDNYGDIGVTWRLARQLVAEQDVAVRLWVDDLTAFARICPQADAQASRQWQQGVEVCHWTSLWQDTPVADVVIGAFACQLPSSYVQAMLECPRAPLWLNLEYLSAEDWVEGCHGLPSPQPNGLRKVFFFPGFTPRTGGLLREAHLLARREAFEQDPAARRAFLQGLGVTPLSDARMISLFAYENSGLGSWLDALAADSRANHLLVPEGRILGDVQSWLGEGALAAGSVATRGALTVQILPFVSQNEYDRLLWCCDFNAVRGEDSFVRAQWAGRPLLWHIYVQEAYAHWEKLEAFLDHYVVGLSQPAKAAIVDLWRAWNMDRDMGQAWQQVLEHWTELDQHARRWSSTQAAQPDLAAALVQFYRNWL